MIISGPQPMPEQPVECAPTQSVLGSAYRVFGFLPDQPLHTATAREARLRASPWILPVQFKPDGFGEPPVAVHRSTLKTVSAPDSQPEVRGLWRSRTMAHSLK